MTNWVERLVGETQARVLHLLRRSRRTINDLSESLGLTDNAVRTHVAALSRDGIIEPVGTQRDTGGKPARLYALTEAGEELFPKAYAMVLAGLVEEIALTNCAHFTELTAKPSAARWAGRRRVSVLRQRKPSST